MNWVSGLILLINAIMDRLPKRMESLKNQRDEYRRQLHELQYKKPFDAVKYGTIANKLYILEKRIDNAGG